MSAIATPKWRKSGGIRRFIFPGWSDSRLFRRQTADRFHHADPEEVLVRRADHDIGVPQQARVGRERLEIAVLDHARPEPPPRLFELDRVLADAGVGEASPVDDRDPDGGVPAFVTGQCAWPSLEDPALILHYLAPTTAADGPAHLTDVLETGTGFAEGLSLIHI